MAKTDATKPDDPAVQEPTVPKTQASKAAPAEPPLPDPEREPDRYTLEVLRRGPQWEVFVKPKSKGKKDTDFVLLARINGIAFWCKRGEKKMVPMEVARIAYAAGMTDSAPPPTHSELTPVGDPLPELQGPPE